MKDGASRPPFRKGGTVTAGNASGVNDGACSLLLASEAAAVANGLTPRARVVACAAALAAIEAIESERLLERSEAIGKWMRTRFADIGARVAPYRMWDIRVITSYSIHYTKLYECTEADFR